MYTRSRLDVNEAAQNVFYFRNFVTLNKSRKEERMLASFCYLKEKPRRIARRMLKRKNSAQ